MNITLGALLRVCGLRTYIVVGDASHSIKWRFMNDKKLHWNCNIKVLFFEPLDDVMMKRLQPPCACLYVFLAGGCCRG